MLELSAGDYRLLLQPERGGSVAAFEWRGHPLFRPTCGPSILDVGCFPLVPFSNRVAFGRFESFGEAVRLSRNFPGTDHPHTVHGFGWLAPWDAIKSGANHALLRHTYNAAEWPWSYVAQQRLSLSEDGLIHELSLRNLSDRPMPAGLGLHPYFPRTDLTAYRGLHCGEWQARDDGLPISLLKADQPKDWWCGAPVSHRSVDTVYTGRAGRLSILWPETGIELTIDPDENLPFTVIYSPADRDFFCVEPVSHATDALNRSKGGEMRRLEAGASFAATVAYRAACVPAIEPFK